jgi:hypothetical protein
MGCDSQFDDAQHCSWESSVEAPTRSRLVTDKGPRIDTRTFAEPLKIEEEDNIPCDCGTRQEEKSHYTFPNRKTGPTKTVVFDQEHCTAKDEVAYSTKEICWKGFYDALLEHSRRDSAVQDINARIIELRRKVIPALRKELDEADGEVTALLRIKHDLNLT